MADILPVILVYTAAALIGFGIGALLRRRRRTTTTLSTRAQIAVGVGSALVLLVAAVFYALQRT